MDFTGRDALAAAERLIRPARVAGAVTPRPPNAAPVAPGRSTSGVTRLLSPGDPPPFDSVVGTSARRCALLPPFDSVVGTSARRCALLTIVLFGLLLVAIATHR